VSTVEKLGRGEVEKHHANAVAVITPTIAGRDALLEEAKACVRAQTIECQHLVGLDARPEPEGPAMIRNVLLARASELGAEYVAFLDDDDLIDPDHVETLLTAMHAEQADLAMSWYRPEGDAPETPRFYVWDDWCLGTMIGGRNLIPVTVVARLEPILAAGGFDPDDRYEDYSLWLRMLEQGATISVTPRETWTYRCLGENRTWQ
jgi:glycosyltransferase involved in cell wall biosynthesis